MKPVEDTHTDPVFSILNDVRQETGYGWARAFNGWVRVMFTTLRRDDESYAELENGYEDEYGRDTTEEIFERYGEAFSELLVGTHETHGDVLGEVHQKAELGSKESGQYFTDGLLGDGMSRMVMPDEEEIDEATPDDPYTVGDPACGSGGLLVAAGRKLLEHDSECPALFVGQDINPICARMTAINFSIHRLPGFVVHGDTFDPEPVASWKIRPESGLCGAPIYETDVAPFAPVPSDQ